MSKKAVVGLLLFASSASFALGFLTHRKRWFDYPRPALAFLLGKTRGCGLTSAYSVLRLKKLSDISKQLFSSSRLVEEAPDGLRRWQTPMGVYWAPFKSDPFWVLAEQQIRIYGDGKYRVREGDVVLDCGANLGAFTREALSAKASVVVAIEPVPENVECLRRTFSQEIANRRVLVVPRGVWDEEKTLKMNIYQDSALHSFVMNTRVEEQLTQPRQAPLPVSTIDQIVGELGLPRVDFIKMDVEGAERNALRGGRETIRKFKPRMSIATENLEDDYLVVPKIVREIDSDYKFICGLCNFTGILDLRPDVLYFYRE